MRRGVYVRVSTDDQRDNGYSIDSQLRMIKEYCEKNEYDIVDVYNDAGHSGKDLMRPEMQRLLKDIKSKKIDKLVAIKVDRLTRNNYDDFWLLNYCEEHDVKIELILEPYDVSTANGEMIFEMNLVFGQRERKEIGARTKRAMEEMALERIHPSKAPYGYIRNKETGHLEVEPIEAEVVKEIFELCKQGNSTRGIATIMKVTYTRKVDYLLPDLYLEKDKNYGRLGRYGILRLHFIAQNKKALYETLLMTNKLTHHLLLVSDSCESLYKILMDDYIKNDERLSEKNKELNPLEWTKLMNNYKNMAEEIVLNEYVFV
ncbi:MAG: TnpV protein [Clostridia bacterium]